MRAAAAAMGAEPRPASLENTPRATPQRMEVSMEATMEPPTPPATESKEKAMRNISATPAGTASKFTIMTIRAVMK